MTTKRLLSLLLALCLVLGCIPMAAAAAEALEAKDWPSNNLIRQSGIYTIPQDLNDTIEIGSSNITVKLVGNAANTADKPYSGLSVVCSNGNVTLIIENLNVTSTGSAVLDFSGTGNTLTLEGTSAFTGSQYGSAALVEVNGAHYTNNNTAAELTINGTGTLNANQPTDTYGAAIGGEAGAPCGTLTIAGGTINAYTSGTGAAIGAGAGAVSPSITISGGNVYAEARYSYGSYSYNHNNTGAAIGGGNGASGGTTNITISGGTVTAVTGTNSAAIGSGLYGPYAQGTDTANITITGGKVMAYTESNSDIATAGGAAIGSAYCGGAANITISGGEVMAVTRTAAAAIGSGAGGSYYASLAATVTVNGGTVTAFANSAYSSPAYKGPAIGRGCYGTNGNIYINAGAVLAVGNADNNMNGTVSDSNGNTLTEVTLEIPGIQGLTIDGVDWKVSANHADLTTEGGFDYSDEVHIWLVDTGDARETAVTTEDGTRNYDLWCSNGVMNEYHTVTYVLSEELSVADAPTKVYDPISAPSWSEDLEGTLALVREADCLQLPKRISVTVDGKNVDVTYNNRTGTFRVDAALLTGDVIITAEAGLEHTWVDANCTTPKTCSVCGATDGQPLEHDPGEATRENEVPSTCSQAGSYDLVVRCTLCGEVLSTEHKTAELGDHSWADATCNAPKTCTECGAMDGTALGHDWTDATCTAPKTCTRCGNTAGVSLGHDFKDGTCTRCGASDSGSQAPADENSVTRIYGDNRFTTAFKVADEMKAVMGVEKFDTIVIASGTNFADALSGSYLAARKNAPILLGFNEKYDQMVADYIKANLAQGGTVYILGGTAAVSGTMEEKLSGLNVKRLAGANRFETNILILKEAGVTIDQTMLVCTGTNFADCLSASATGAPILLVWNESGKLLDCQKEFLDAHCGSATGARFRFVGGYSAVSFSMEKVFRSYGTTDRISGNNRFETSAALAKAYFADDCTQAVLAYAANYPDGLCGGPLAHVVGAPLILTMTGYESAAAAYTADTDIRFGIVLGGDKLISDAAVRAIFVMDADAGILVK